MSTARLLLSQLRITDGAVPPAELEFTPGLNLIIGASDTGKTFVFEAIDFMLGARDPLRRIPASAGYTQVLLTIEATNAPSFVLKRAFEGGEIEAVEYRHGASAPMARRILSPVHGPDPNTSLSSYLLRAIGVEGRQIRKNARGDKQALSFRNICRLVLISEQRIIQQSSPVLSGQAISRTADQSAFAFLLSGRDDSDVIAQENPQQRNARLAVEENVLEGLVAEKRGELRELLGESTDFSEQAARLDEAIQNESELLVASQEQISELEERRKESFNERTEKQSRLVFLDEQLKRLRLLDQYYETDRARLGTVIEASRVFHELPAGTCPMCGQSYGASGRDASTSAHSDFEGACLAEIEKIDILRRDLGEALGDFTGEDTTLRSDVARLDFAMREIDQQLQGVLIPASRTAHSELQSLIGARTRIAAATALHSTVLTLEQRLDRVNATRAQRVPRGTFENRATTSVATEFCGVVEEILRAWRYPNVGTVTLDSERLDLVINGEDRANKGKGYRALTYAAFVIGLMKYCRRKEIPHPGFVVLDTPVNPFKGPVVSAEENLTDDVKVAFFQYLANDASGDQVIVMENEEPPAMVRESVNYYRFTKNPELDRYGFFPHR